MTTRFHRSRAPRLEPDKARRQGQITQLALVLLGREKAIDFLNSDNAELGARPLDLATESAAGCASVEATLGRMTLRPAAEI
ncbi:antitoxin Xre/MbcA/ParS toxin-binding domain-containing protein [Pelagerythrobacter marinus]|uniref:antitoxin Xre/MbcA/ParS toxin-binding domain-containing protein n=1 Tax=Pelagerythrobacter marinus TaxID=538382 RepID=UPI002AC965BE|nr:antitoxin Xre/MbcA/ParS toxin-binding domain-containing protein [Pelagerythrobacter marinus]WPZ07619.1 antitoxin Xre/MbcA/ParS toxin-binding domain-containing protein [Pelagerythrobacter marinus]